MIAISNVQVANGHRYRLFADDDGRTYWECDCGRSGSSGDELAAEIKADEHTCATSR